MRPFTEVVKLAYANRIQLWSDGFYRTPKIHYDKTTLTGRPFYYFAYGAACSEVAIDTLTGESRVLKVDILHDVGTSINPAIDIGSAAGSAGIAGAMTAASITPSPTLTETGTALLPNRGAAAIRPRMRVSGHNRAAIHVFISALVSVIMGRVCWQRCDGSA